MKEKVLSILFFSLAIILFISGFVASGGITIWVIIAADVFAVLGAAKVPVSRKKHKYN